MKRNWKRILAAFLAACIIFGDSSLVYATESLQNDVDTSIAEEVSEEEIADEEAAEENTEEVQEEDLPETSEDKEKLYQITPVTEVCINPLYEDVISEEDILNSAAATMQVDEPEVYVNVDEIIEMVRGELVERNTNIVFAYEYAYEGSFDSEAVYELMDNILEEALIHTGNPKEGDYLRWNYGSYIQGYSGYYSNEMVHLELSYAISWYTSAEMETEMNEAVDRVLSELELEGMDEYEQIRSIYDYICENVTYDYTNLNNESYLLKYTPYAALINGTSVCQGYATLFYRLALEADLDARVITGDAGGPHAWNIVRLNESYYNLDSTWDAGEDEYDYFLQNMDEFSNHVRAEEYLSDSFTEAYPMAENTYVEEDVQYSGSVVSDESGDCLYIRHWEVADTFNDEVILNALNAWDRTFDQIMICYPNNYSTTIPAAVWNAVKALDGSAENSNGFLFDGGMEMNVDWYIDDMETASAPVALTASVNIGGTDQYGFVTVVDAQDIPAGSAHVRFNSLKWNDGDGNDYEKNDYQSIVDAFGQENMEFDLALDGQRIGNRSDRYEWYQSSDDTYYNINADICLDNVEYLADGTYEMIAKRAVSISILHDEEGNADTIVLTNESSEDISFELCAVDEEANLEKCLINYMIPADRSSEETLSALAEIFSDGEPGNYSLCACRINGNEDEYIKLEDFSFVVTKEEVNPVIVTVDATTEVWNFKEYALSEYEEAQIFIGRMVEYPMAMDLGADSEVSDYFYFDINQMLEDWSWPEYGVAKILFMKTFAGSDYYEIQQYEGTEFEFITSGEDKEDEEVDDSVFVLNKVYRTESSDEWQDLYYTYDFTPEESGYYGVKGELFSVAVRTENYRWMEPEYCKNWVPNNEKYVIPEQYYYLEAGETYHFYLNIEVDAGEEETYQLVKDTEGDTAVELSIDGAAHTMQAGEEGFFVIECSNPGHYECVINGEDYDYRWYDMGASNSYNDTALTAFYEGRCYLWMSANDTVSVEINSVETQTLNFDEEVELDCEKSISYEINVEGLDVFYLKCDNYPEEIIGFYESGEASDISWDSFYDSEGVEWYLIEIPSGVTKVSILQLGKYNSEGEMISATDSYEFENQLTSWSKQLQYRQIQK